MILQLIWYGHVKRMYDEGLLKISLHYKANLKEDGEDHKRIG